MKTMIIKAVSVVVAMACLLCCPVKASAAMQQGTNGTELAVVQAQQLEIQLGQAWTGVEFQLRTDAGKYPEHIPVDEDGVLRIEIGGSENYLLTCLTSQVTPPNPDEAAETSTTPEPESTLTEKPSDSTEPEITIHVTDPIAEKEPAMIGNIPTAHLIIFVGSLIVAIALLLFMQTHHKNRDGNNADDENDEI